jgi:chromosome segregation ATPase
MTTATTNQTEAVAAIARKVAEALTPEEVDFIARDNSDAVASRIQAWANKVAGLQREVAEARKPIPVTETRLREAKDSLKRVEKDTALQRADEWKYGQQRSAALEKVAELETQLEAQRDHLAYLERHLEAARKE